MKNNLKIIDLVRRVNEMADKIPECAQPDSECAEAVRAGKPPPCKKNQELLDELTDIMVAPYAVEGGGIQKKIVQIQAKLKDRGWKSLEEVEVLIAEKAQKQMCIDDLIRQLKELEANRIEWDREKVALELYERSVANNETGRFHQFPDVKDFWYKRAAQLKEILTGGKDVA